MGLRPNLVASADSAQKLPIPGHQKCSLAGRIEPFQKLDSFGRDGDHVLKQAAIADDDGSLRRLGRDAGAGMRFEMIENIEWQLFRFRRLEDNAGNRML